MTALGWLDAFALTQMVEIGIYLGAFADKRPFRERLAIAFGASAITHPLVWFVIPELLTSPPFDLPWMTMVWFAEAFAVIVEAAWLWSFGVRFALFWSFAANLSSFALGLFCYHFLRW